MIVLERFFWDFVEELPERKAVVAADATGYSERTRG
jgi:hypothetical protein